MASSTSNSFVFVRFILSIFLLSLCLLFPLKGGYASEERESYLTHTIQLSSLLPSSVCNHSSKADERKSTLRIIDKYGPCFEPNDQDKAKPPSLADIVRLDRSRLDLIHSKLYKNSSARRDMIEQLDATEIPVIDGSNSFGTQQFLVTLGFGTPEKKLSLVIDSGSDITWTQCDPCAKCYDQKEPRYNNKQSQTYISIPCDDPLCDIAPHADGLRCQKDRCAYKINYSGGQSTRGLFAKETLTLTSSEVLTDFMFGCGRYQKGKFDKPAGVLGLDRSQVSIVSQTESKYKKIFSYCLPSTSSNSGHLTFGSHSLPQDIIYTKLVTTHSTFYGLGLVGIGFGVKKLPITEPVFQSGTIIDSGAVLSFLPKDAYDVLEAEFRSVMSKYPEAPAYEGLDVCYNPSGDQSFKVPPVSLYFADKTVVTLPDQGSIIVASKSQVCLAFVDNKKSSDLTVIGNTAQKSMEVVYDIPNERIGFALKGGC